MTPPEKTFRPTSSRTREALFNKLVHGLGKARIDWAGLKVADVFAGTGALGLEALSRGAAHATFLDANMVALDVVRRNASALGEIEGVTLVQCDALQPVKSPVGSCGLVFLDPPYGEGLAPIALSMLSETGWVESRAIVVIEISAKESFAEPKGYTVIDSRRHSTARIVFLQAD